MPTVNPKTYHQSASSVGAFKACPVRFRLAYREGLRLIADTDSQRMGTNWHGMFEHHANALTDWKAGEEEYEKAKDAALEAVIVHLNERYAEVPKSKTPLEWEIERQVLLMSFIGYQWFYQNDPVEFLYSELPFNLPLHLPQTGLPLPMEEVRRVGKMDHIIKWQGMVGVLERKSTSRSIDADSDYWDKAKKDTQVSMYALAFRDMAQSETLPFAVPADMRAGSTLYDVWHKPTIKPKMLTQAETKAFIETGEYCDQKFEVASSGDQTQPETWEIRVNDDKTEIEPGKKGFAIRETPGMFGARLLADIYERPDFYFVRREIARTDSEIRSFRGQLFAIYQTQKLMEKHDCWFENESACRATFACAYIPICYGPGADAVCDGKSTPPGFKRIFVDLTVNGVEVDE